MLFRNSFDVAIIGGGPAGANAAFALARRGVAVVILEKEPLPRYKTCGGGVVRRAIQLLPFEVDEAVEVKCRAIDINFLDAGLHFSVVREKPVISMAMRSRFDFLLVSEAVRSGAVLWQDCGALDLSKKEDHVEIHTPRGPLTVRFAVLAAGAGDRLAQKAGWAEPLHPVPALEWEVYLDGRSLERFQRAPRFDFGVVSRGYGWIFPKRDHLSAGVLSFLGSSANLNRCLKEYLQKIGITSIQKAERHGFVFPARPRRDSFAKGRLLLAGDASGLVDPITCEGITSALRSGQLAAEALLESRFDPEEAGRIYDRRIRGEILAEHRLAWILSRLLYRCPRLSRWLFRSHGPALCEAMTDVFTGERSYSEVLLEWRQYRELLEGLTNCKA